MNRDKQRVGPDQSYNTRDGSHIQLLINTDTALRIEDQQQSLNDRFSGSEMQMTNVLSSSQNMFGKSQTF